MTKSRINLLKDELIAVQTWLNLTNVVRIWVVTFVLLILVWALQEYQQVALEKKYDQLKKKNVQLNSQLEQYEDILDTRTIDPRKTNQLSTLKFIFQNKQVLHRQLTDHTQVRVSGFADVMSELADNHNREISLHTVRIINNDISMTGLARNANSVPKWLTGFEQTKFMAGKQFSQFNLTVEDGETKFVVRSSQDSSGDKQ